MSRIISLLSLMMIVGGMAYVYYTGLFTAVFDPRVRVMVAEQNLIKGQPLRPANYVMKDIPINDVRSGYITFPLDVSKDSLGSTLSRRVISEEIEKGEVLTFSHLGERGKLFIMRVISDIEEGDPLERSNVMISPETGDVPDGAVVFSKDSAGTERYLTGGALKAAKKLRSGDTIKVDDVGGEASSVFVLRSMNDFTSGSTISVNDLSAVPVPVNDIPRGSIAFPSKQAGEFFATTSGGLMLSAAIYEDEVLTVGALSKAGAAPLSDGEVPQTLKELLEYQSKFPGTTIFVNDKILVGSTPQSGVRLDLWVEMGSTEGPYGVTKLQKMAKASETFKVDNPVQTENGEIMESRYWAQIGKTAHTALEEARKEERIAFMVSTATSISDFLGNGAVCRENVCTVSRGVSDNLGDVRTALGEIGDTEESVDAPKGGSLLLVLDGVDDEVESRLISRGYRTLRDIAAWEDSGIKVIAFNLEISQNLAIYLRQQARNIVDAPEKSRRDLGLTSSDFEE